MTIEQKSDKLVVVGGGPSHVHTLALKGKADIWTLPFSAPQYNGIANLCFDLHRPEVLRQNHALGILKADVEAYYADLKRSFCPVMMCEKYEEFPMSERFPIERILSTHGAYFNSSIAYIIAYALEFDYKEMYLFGIDLAEEEYIEQRPCAEFYIGKAIQKGIEVIIPYESSLLKCPNLYGYQQQVGLKK